MILNYDEVKSFNLEELSRKLDEQTRFALNDLDKIKRIIVKIGTRGSGRGKIFLEGSPEAVTDQKNVKDDVYLSYGNVTFSDLDDLINLIEDKSIKKNLLTRIM
jgi:hypothetical protein